MCNWSIHASMLLTVTPSGHAASAWENPRQRSSMRLQSERPCLTISSSCGHSLCSLRAKCPPSSAPPLVQFVISIPAHKTKAAVRGLVDADDGRCIGCSNFNVLAGGAGSSSIAVPCMSGRVLNALNSSRCSRCTDTPAEGKPASLEDACFVMFSHCSSPAKFD